MGKVISVIILFLFLAVPSRSCVVLPCDLSVTYAISKQKSVLSTRLEELKKVIHALAEGSLYMGGLQSKEVRELLRLRERMKLELLASYNIDFHTRILKEIESIKKIRGREELKDDEE